jgi:L-rhamnose isomerase
MEVKTSMTSFYNVMSNSIMNNYKTKERTYYETAIAKWSLNGWLTDEEVAKLLVLLEGLYGTNVTTDSATV